jgi:hypothetical protein
LTDKEPTMLTYNASAELKAEHVAHAEAHFAAEQLLSGTYGTEKNGKFYGCSVGCFAHDIAPDVEDNRHEIVANHYALPEWLVRLQDSMFEGLPQEDRGTFHVELAKRIPLGADLTPVPHWIAIARIDRMLETQRKVLEAKHPQQVHDAIAQVISALEIGRRAHEAAAGGNVCELPAAESAARSAESAESAAESAAWSAWSARSAESAESAAWSAAWSARSAKSAESAAWSAWSARSAESAESAAESAAWSARSARSAESAESAAWSARSAAWKQERDALFAALDRLA